MKVTEIPVLHASLHLGIALVLCQGMLMHHARSQWTMHFSMHAACILAHMYLVMLLDICHPNGDI